MPADYRVKVKESEKKDKYLDLARELEKLWNMKVMVISFVFGTLASVIKGLVNGLEDIEITARVEIIHNIDEIGQNTEKSPGDLRRLVTQIPVKDHLLTLMWKILTV